MRRFGKNCKAYYNSGSFAAPTWVELTNIRDANLGNTKREADITTRGSGGIGIVAGTIKDFEFTFEALDDDDDAGYVALETAYFADATIEVLILNGPRTETGVKGLRAHMEVMDFSRGESLENAVIINFSLKPGYFPSGEAPQWVTGPVS